jgi:hypothetical protein
VYDPGSITVAILVAELYVLEPRTCLNILYGISLKGSHLAPPLLSVQRKVLCQLLLLKCTPSTVVLCPLKVVCTCLAFVCSLCVARYFFTYSRCSDGVVLWVLGNTLAASPSVPLVNTLRACLLCISREVLVLTFVSYVPTKPCSADGLSPHLPQHNGSVSMRVRVRVFAQVLDLALVYPSNNPQRSSTTCINSSIFCLIGDFARFTPNAFALVRAQVDGSLTVATSYVFPGLSVASN